MELAEAQQKKLRASISSMMSLPIYGADHTIVYECLVGIGAQLVRNADAVIYEVIEIEQDNVTGQVFYLIRSNLTGKVERIASSILKLFYSPDLFNSVI